MFHKTRRKITVVIMSVLTALFMGTLVMIAYVSSYKLYQSEQDMLQIYVDAYWQNGNPAGTSHTLTAPVSGSSKGTMVSPQQTFYSVAFSTSGSVTAIDNEDSDRLSDDQFIHMARTLMNSSHHNGRTGEWVYSIDTKGQTTLVTFLDHSVMDQTTSTWLRYCILFGGLSLILLFFISRQIAKRIVQPLEISFVKQKQFLSDASHELKTPLAVMATNLELLEREQGENTWLSNIRLENQRMNGLVCQMLDLAQTENQTQTMELLDISHLLTGELLPFESVAYEKQLTLTSDIEEQQMCYGNKDQLSHLFGILIDNGIDHGFSHTEIHVSLARVRNEIQIIFSNHGQPLSQEEQRKVFDRFYRQEQDRPENDGHYGLGLAIAKAIVTSHHGTIKVDCQGELIRFTVMLPCK